MKSLATAIVACLLLTPVSAPPKVLDTFDAKVIGVTDGDTAKVLRDKQQIIVRLEGIDAPEKNQAFGGRSKIALSNLAFGKMATIQVTGTDKYGRTLARLRVDGKDVSESMVQQGMAWHYKEYSKDDALAELEITARDAKVGLWTEANALPPWEFRSRQRVAVAPPEAQESSTATATPPLRHWLNTSSDVRHNASCQYFRNTKKGRLCGPKDGKACGTCGG